MSNKMWSCAIKVTVMHSGASFISERLMSRVSACRASFDGRHTMRMQRNTSIRCTTSSCALPMINSERLDRDWYEGIKQKLKWNVPIRNSESVGPPPTAPSRMPRGAAALAAKADLLEQAIASSNGFVPSGRD